MIDYKENMRVRDALGQLLSLDVGSHKLTVDQEVGGSNPPSCTRQDIENAHVFPRS
jgi:hypothetical protein